MGIRKTRENALVTLITWNRSASQDKELETLSTFLGLHRFQKILEITMGVLTFSCITKELGKLKKIALVTFTSR